MGHGNDGNVSDNAAAVIAAFVGAAGLQHFAADVWRKPDRIKAEEKNIDKAIESRTDLSASQKADLELEIHWTLEHNRAPGRDVPAKGSAAAAEKVITAGVRQTKAVDTSLSPKETAAKVATAEQKLDKVARDKGLSPKDTTTLIEMEHAILEGNRSALDRLMHTTPLSDLKIVLPALSADMKAAGLTIKLQTEGQWALGKTMDPYASLIIYPPHGDSYVTFSTPTLRSGINSEFGHTLEETKRAFKSIGEKAVDKLNEGDKHKK